MGVSCSYGTVYCAMSLPVTLVKFNTTVLQIIVVLLVLLHVLVTPFVASVQSVSDDTKNLINLINFERELKRPSSEQS